MKRPFEFLLYLFHTIKIIGNDLGTCANAPQMIVDILCIEARSGLKSEGLRRSTWKQLIPVSSQSWLWCLNFQIFKKCIYLFSDLEVETQGVRMLRRGKRVRVTARERLRGLCVFIY